MTQLIYLYQKGLFIDTTIHHVRERRKGENTCMREEVLVNMYIYINNELLKIASVYFFSWSEQPSIHSLPLSCKAVKYPSNKEWTISFTSFIPSLRFHHLCWSAIFSSLCLYLLSLPVSLTCVEVLSISIIVDYRWYTIYTCTCVCVHVPPISWLLE